MCGDHLRLRPQDESGNARLTGLALAGSQKGCTRSCATPCRRHGQQTHLRLIRARHGRVPTPPREESDTADQIVRGGLGHEYPPLAAPSFDVPQASLCLGSAEAAVDVDVAREFADDSVFGRRDWSNA